MKDICKTKLKLLIKKSTSTIQVHCYIIQSLSNLGYHLSYVKICVVDGKISSWYHHFRHAHATETAENPPKKAETHAKIMIQTSFHIVTFQHPIRLALYPFDMEVFSLEEPPALDLAPPIGAVHSSGSGSLFWIVVSIIAG